MKNRFLSALIVSGMMVMTSCTPQGVVPERPLEIVSERPVSPGPDYVWVDGDWVYENHRYQWHEGRWDHAKSGRQWQKGHWEQVKKDGNGIKGRWK